MISKILFLLAGLLVAGSAVLAEPPPRDQRAPPSHKPGQRAPFFDTAWRPSYPIPFGWQPRYFHYETKYEVVSTPEGSILTTYADGTASWISQGMIAKLDAEAPSCLNWSWSADTLPTLSEPEDSLAGDDFAIRLYVFGILETGQNFGFNYVWSNEHPRGAIWTSPWSTNKLMALQQGPNPDGKLVWESRNLIADIFAATGEKPVQVTSIAIMSDAEGSGSYARARISPVQFGECRLLMY